jgi:four helix bundle protein
MKVAAKEASETQYWLLMSERSSIYPNPVLLQATLEEVNRILNSIIATSKRKNPFSYFLTLFM